MLLDFSSSRSHPQRVMATTRPAVGARAKDGLLIPMARLADMIERHLDSIVAFWERRTTNAHMEALNRVFSAVRRKACGYRTEFHPIPMVPYTPQPCCPATH